MKPQNRSNAVMSTRIEPDDSRDDFPTPPWATRALLEFGIPDACGTVLEPACGAGHMVHPLAEVFDDVEASDAYDYQYATMRDFLEYRYMPQSFDWVITNPPFRLGEQFLYRAMTVARIGVALLLRTVFVEGIGRHERIYRRWPCTVAQFAERVPMVKGRLDPNATTATAYAWFIWRRPYERTEGNLIWIPPCRKQLEKPGDYP